MQVSIRLAVALLVALGMVAAAGRALTLARAESLTAVYALYPTLVARDALLLDQWFASQASLTWVHILTGVVLLSLAPLQFSTRLRLRHVRLHRWSGRLVLLAGVPAALSGLVLHVRSPYGGIASLSAAAAVTVLFLAAALLAYLAIRRRDIVAHREWVTRLFAVALGVGGVRLAWPILFLIIGRPPLEYVGAAFWIGLGIPVTWRGMVDRAASRRACAGCGVKVAAFQAPLLDTQSIAHRRHQHRGARQAV